MQNLLSEAAVIPSLLHQFDTLLCNPCQTSPSEITNMLGSFVGALDYLENWEWCFQQDDTAMHYWPVVTNAQFTGPTRHGALFWFPSVTMANIYTHLWAFRIACLIEIGKLTAIFPTVTFAHLSPPNHFDFDHIQGHMMVLAEKICLSMDYLMQDGMKLFGPASTFYPLQVAYRAFKMDESEQKENMARVEGVVGWLIKKGLQSAPSIVFGRDTVQKEHCTFNA